MPETFLTLQANSHSIYGYDSVGAEYMTSLGQANCHNYTVWGDNSDCNVDLPAGLSQIYLLARFRAVQYETVEEGVVNGFGEFIQELTRQEYINSFVVITNEHHLSILQQYELYPKLFIQPINPGGSATEIYDWNVEVVDFNEPVYEVTVSFKVKDSSQLVLKCCDSASFPYDDPCVGGSGNPPPPASPECDGFDVSISYDGTTLTADVTADPSNTYSPSYNWYKDGVSLGSGGSITESGPGSYRVDVVQGPCSDSYTFLVQDECTTFAVTLEYDNGVLIATPNRQATLTWEYDDGAGYVVISGQTDGTYIPTASGDYRVTADADGCQDVAELLGITVEDDCTVTVSIAVSGNVATATPLNCVGTPTYVWKKDTGSGETVISGATTNSISIAEQGLYIVEVQCDGCTARAQRVIIGDCTDFAVYIDYIDFDGTDVVAAAGVLNAPGSVTFDWFQATNGEWLQIDSGNVITIDTAGALMVRATSDNCQKEHISQACIDPAEPEYQERFTATAGQEVFSPSVITLPDPTLYSVEEIGAEYEVFRNGVRILYVDSFSSPAKPSEWKITAGDIEFNWPSKAGDVIVLIKRYIP